MYMGIHEALAATRMTGNYTNCFEGALAFTGGLGTLGLFDITVDAGGRLCT
jgi:hypothetical protein